MPAQLGSTGAALKAASDAEKSETAAALVLAIFATGCSHSKEWSACMHLGLLEKQLPRQASEQPTTDRLAFSRGEPIVSSFPGSQLHLQVISFN